MRTNQLKSWYRRGALLVALLSLGGTLGCGASSGGSDSLAGTTRTTASMDGFVFVPSRSRQVASGDTSIPHALIRVFLLPRMPGDSPIFTTQADATGFYRIDFTNDPDQVLNKGLVVLATDPFDPARTLRAVISFQDATDVKNRNLTPTSTIAAAIVENEGYTEPLSDSQITQLETLADDVFADLDPDQDPTTDDTILQNAATTAAANGFGRFEISVFSDPTVTANVILNGFNSGLVPTALPETSTTRQNPTVSGNTLTIARAIVGTTRVQLTAPGFLTDEFTVDIIGGQTTTVERTLVQQPPPGQNLPPVVISSRITPQTLPFQGGQVQLYAQVQDPEGDAITGTFSILRTIDAAGNTAVFLNGDLAQNQQDFAALVSVPGNPNTFNQTYTATLSFTDGTDRPVVRRVRQFQVSGLEAPPTPPTDTGDSSARALIGQWNESASGPDPNSLSASSGRTLIIRSDATVTLLTGAGTVNGTIAILQTAARLEGPVFSATLHITSSTDSLFTVGEAVPLDTQLSADLATLLTVLRPGDALQEAVQWARAIAQ